MAYFTACDTVAYDTGVLFISI